MQLEFGLEKLPCFATLTYSPSDGKWDQKVEDKAEDKLKELFKLINKSAINNSNSNNNINNNNLNEKDNDLLNTAANAPVIVGGYAVYPKTDCPHIGDVVLNNIEIDCGKPCEVCGDKDENWVCLLCNKVRCSRYKNKHMVDHVEEEGRCHKAIVASYADFSFWCNKCEDYISHPSLHIVRKAMEISKFK